MHASCFVPQVHGSGAGTHGAGDAMVLAICCDFLVYREEGFSWDSPISLQFDQKGRHYRAWDLPPQRHKAKVTCIIHQQ